MIKTYRELCRFNSFEDRFDYLRLDGTVGRSTFGIDRYINQDLYHSSEWRHTRHGIILRDNGCDLGVRGYEIISSGLTIHHINPITIADIERGRDCVFDPENLITTRMMTHNAIHFGLQVIPVLPVERYKNDTCLWHRK